MKDVAPGESSPRPPLEGYRVLDMSSVLMGPLASQMLADLGADVIVIERAGGDPNRDMGIGPHPQFSGLSLNLMRGKRSVVLDVTDPCGREVFERLVASSDVFLTNLRPASRRRARLTDDDLRPLRPDLIYCVANGFGADDPRADDPAYDDIIQAATGVVDVQRLAGLGATYAPMVVADKVSGMAIAQSIIVSLLDRERTGRGASLELSMFEVMTAFTLAEHGGAAIPAPPLGPAGNQRLLNPCRRPLATRDGMVGMLIYERQHFEGLVREAGREDLLNDPRFRTRVSRLEHLDELYAICTEVASRLTTEQLLELCRRADVPVHRVVTLDELVAGLPEDEHPHAGAYRRTPSLAGGRRVAVGEQRPAPPVGEHTDEIMAELGLSPAEAGSDPSGR